MKRLSHLPGSTGLLSFVLLVLIVLVESAVAEEKPLSESAQMAAEARGKAIMMRRLEVTETVVGSIGVNFTMDKEDPAYPGATIFWATITDVPPGSTAQKAGFRLGDEIIRLNDQLVRGMTQGEFFSLIKHERRQGNLVWKIRRGILGIDFYITFNGKSGSTVDP